MNNPVDELEEMDVTDDDDEVQHPYLESNRSWLPSLSTAGPGDATKSSREQAAQAGPSGENQVGKVGVTGPGRFVPKEILEQITSSILETLSK